MSRGSQGFMGRAFARLSYKKNIDRLLLEARDEKKGLAKTLEAKDLIILGVAGIIGAGIFVLIGEGIATSGVGVIPAFVVAALICAVAGYAYAELSSSIPASGSAYAYIYTALGELPGWLVAWALVLEYAVGAIAVSIGWRNNFLALLNQFHDSDPTTDVFSNDRAWFGGNTDLWYGITHSPFEHVTLASGAVLDGIINLPSILIVLLVTLLLVRGTKESARVTFVLVLIKVSILLLAIVGGFLAFDAANFDEPFPVPSAEFPDAEDVSGFGGIVSAIIATAAILFFAYIGFDSVSTTAEETKNPKKDMPKGILGSLIITTILYVLAAFALVGASNWTQFTGDSVEATNARGEPFGYVFEKNGFLEVNGFALGALLVRIGALVGTTSVLLVLILGGVRVFFNMARDGLLPVWLSKVSTRGAPAAGTLFYGGFTVLFAGLLTLGRAIDLVNIGTLFAFLMVVLATWLFRIRRPDVERPFKMPMWSVYTRDGKPYVAMLPILGIVGICVLIYFLDNFTKIAALTWTGVGLLFYGLYSIRNSKEAHERQGGPGLPGPSTGGKPVGVATGAQRAGAEEEAPAAKPGLRLAGGDAAILDVEGIGPVYAAKLQAEGIETAYQLRGRDTDRLAKGTGIPAANLALWQTMAELLPVKGVGPQYAEVLARSGVTSIDDLAGRDAAQLTRTINKFLGSKDVTIVGVDVTEKRVASWIREGKLSHGPKAAASGLAGGKGAFKHNGFTLYGRDTNGRKLYFFARNTPKSGQASALPAGYEVGENAKTGLPFLRKA